MAAADDLTILTDSEENGEVVIDLSKTLENINKACTCSGSSQGSDDPPCVDPETGQEIPGCKGPVRTRDPKEVQGGYQHKFRIVNY